MLQAPLVEVLNMKIVFRGLASVLVTSYRNRGNSVGVWTIERATDGIYGLLRYYNIKRNKGFVRRSLLLCPVNVSKLVQAMVQICDIREPPFF